MKSIIMIIVTISLIFGNTVTELDLTPSQPDTIVIKYDDTVYENFGKFIGFTAVLSAIGVIIAGVHASKLK